MNETRPSTAGTMHSEASGSSTRTWRPWSAGSETCQKIRDRKRLQHRSADKTARRSILTNGKEATLWHDQKRPYSRSSKPRAGRLDAYLEREADMLAKNGVQSYGIGSRNIQYYSTALKDIQDMIEKLRARIRELEAELEGRAPRRALGVVPRDW